MDTNPSSSSAVSIICEHSLTWFSTWEESDYDVCQLLIERQKHWFIVCDNCLTTVEIWLTMLIRTKQRNDDKLLCFVNWNLILLSTHLSRFDGVYTRQLCSENDRKDEWSLSSSVSKNRICKKRSQTWLKKRAHARNGWFRRDTSVMHGENAMIQCWRWTSSRKHLHELDKFCVHSVQELSFDTRSHYVTRVYSRLYWRRLCVVSTVIDCCSLFFFLCW